LDWVLAPADAAVWVGSFMGASSPT
jgi:hypothetical protein